MLGCNAEWLSPVPMAPELTEELVDQILARSRAKQGSRCVAAQGPEQTNSTLQRQAEK